MPDSAASTLLVDAGNTRLKWGLVRGEVISSTGSLIWEKQTLDQQLAANWQSFMDPAQYPARILLANVAGVEITQAVEAWATACQEALGVTIPVDCVKSQAQAYGVQNSYAHPEGLGVDRWLALVAARHTVQGAACVVDCGTALTVDVISAQGVHQGGIIVPGMKLMKQSLAENTDAIPDSEGSGSELLGKDTQSALQGGALAAASGAVMQVMQQATILLGETPTAIITGGDAPLLLPMLGDSFRHEPDWVLKGLAVIAAGEA